MVLLAVQSITDHDKQLLCMSMSITVHAVISYTHMNTHALKIYFEQ